VSAALALWNQLPMAEAENEIVACCGSLAWARGMVRRRPLGDEAALLVASDEIWHGLSEADWREAFRAHPRIGESRTEQQVGGRSSAWSAEEQSGVAAGGDAVKIALAEANREYERRFGHIFIVCANGKSAAEIWAILRQRLQNDAMTELREAAEQQRQITRIRLKRWLAG
jgi:2-oxo-4-hydroxy-4-carboxy-5-ureidoimidazoline decarboxylase